MSATTATPESILRVQDPATGDLLAELPIASAVDVQAALDRARAAQPTWDSTPVRERAKILRRFTSLLAASQDEVADLVARESGKPVVEALLTEVTVALDAARYCSNTIHGFLRPERVPHANLLAKAKRGYLRREPCGVVGIIAPWNYPFSIPATEVVAALATGNTVVLKPSEFTPLTAIKLVELLHRAGVPRDALQVVIGEGAAGAALLECERPVDKLIFTGSVATGKLVAQAAAPKLIPVVLELGGKDAFVVLEDADVEIASSAAVWGAFVNAGQTCLSVERCYVHRSLFDRFVQACAEKTKKLRVGRGTDPDTDVGPMIHARQLQIVESQVREAVQQGARVICGGERLPQLGPNFYAPTIMTNVSHDMRLMLEETFGPVLPIMAFDSEQEAVRFANDSDFGLAASVWTSDAARGEALAQRLRVGSVMVNDAVAYFGISEAPHGGVRGSGIGRTHGRAGLEELTQLKYVDVDAMPGMKKVWWYGYGPTFREHLRGFIDLVFAGSLGRRLSGGWRSRGALFRKRH